jgi:Amt family ammonium transporter
LLLNYPLTTGQGNLAVANMSTIVLPEYDPSTPAGGNPLAMDVNAKFQNLEFHAVYQMLMACFVFLIIPGLGLLYGGLSERKSALSMMFQSLAVISVITFQWMFWGFSLAFSRTGNSFIGDLSNFGLRGTMAAPSWGAAVLPDIVFCLYQMLFAMCAAAIVIGGAFARGKIFPSLIFLFCWVTIVYCPIASWTWNANGWAYKLGVLDFAGGSPVHMSTGAAGLAYALVLGKRRSSIDNTHHKPHNLTTMFLGTVLIFAGWLGFNGGSALNASVRSYVAVFNTIVGGSMGLVGFTLVSYFKHGRKWSVKAACEGIIAGLVGITPAAGYVQPWLGAVIGVLTGAACCSLDGMGHWIGIDDGLEVFKLHAVGGAVGSFLTGCFATSRISSLDGLGSEYSGAIDGHGIQIGYQLADICATLSYSFVVSAILLYILKYIPFVGLRVSEEAEEMGLDLDQFHDEAVDGWDDFPGAAREVTHGVAPTKQMGISSPDGSLTPQKHETKTA